MISNTSKGDNFNEVNMNKKLNTQNSSKKFQILTENINKLEEHYHNTKRNRELSSSKSLKKLGNFNAKSVRESLLSNDF